MQPSRHTSYRAGELEEEDGTVSSQLVHEYLRKCKEPFSKEAVQAAAAVGNQLLIAAGSIKRAASQVNSARIAAEGEHLQAAKDGKLRGLSEEHAAYLKTCVEEGVPSRARSVPQRERAKNHGSVRGHEEEMMQKAWKDSYYGAVLLCSTETDNPQQNEDVEHILVQDGVSESPLGRVPKQNPDRTISSEGRPINDMRARNSHGSKYDHPPASQPRHRAVVRQSLWWRARHPKVPQRCAKRDVPRAFKWHYLQEKDVPEFCTKLMGIVILSLVMVFGWVGAPGEFVIWATAAQKHHGTFRPALPRFNDVVPYTSRWLMDDGVVVEPLVGNRIQRSLAAMDESMEMVWGPRAINQDKLVEEGIPAASQLLWGLHLDFEAQTVTLPEPKRMKAKYLLRESELQRGCTKVRTKLVRELAGSAQYWAVSAPEIAPYLPIFYRLLRQHPGEHAHVNPRGTPEEVAEVWEEFWDALDWVRLQMEKPWGSSFRVAFGKLLPLRERLALPGFAQKTRFIGGDATLERLGAADWKSKEYFVAGGADYLKALEKVAGPGENLDIIAVMELLTLVVLANRQQSEWKDQMIMYVTDNANVQQWLKSRRARNKYVRTLLLLLQRLEAESCFTVDGVFVRTYHNTLNDWLTREGLAEVHQGMKEKGWTELKLKEDWEEALRGAVRPTLQLPGELGPTAELACQLARQEQVPRNFAQKRPAVKFYGTLSQIRVGLDLIASFEQAWSIGGGTVVSNEQAELLTWISSNKESEKETSQLLAVLDNSPAHRVFIIEAPSTAELPRLHERLRQRYPFEYQRKYVSSHLGSFFARRRQVWVYSKFEINLPDLSQWRVREVNGCWMLPLEPFTQDNSLHGGRFVFTREPNIVTTGDPWLPKPCGHIYDKQTQQRHLVHSVKGVACGPRVPGDPLKGPGSTLLEDGTGRVRPLDVSELWEMQGGAKLLWPPASESKKQQFLQAAIRTCGWQCAQSLLQAIQQPQEGKAGILDQDELEAHSQLEVWLKAWGKNHHHPSEEIYLTSVKEKPPQVAPTHGETIAGAPKRSVRKKIIQESEECLVQPSSGSQQRATPVSNIIRGGNTTLDQIALEAVMAKLADSTRRVYASGWKQWVLFNMGSKEPLFLDGEGRSARAEDEQRLIRFVVFLHQVMNRSIGGIRQRLSAIRYAHVSTGYPDPLAGRPRLWAAVAGLQRWEGSPLRKLPVTPNMLRWLIKHIKSSGFSVPDQKMIQGALLTGWFFMHRASELLPSSDGTDPLSRALRPADVTFYKKGEPCRGSEADEVVVQIRSSKTDQYGRGQARSHHRSGGDLCPVEALAALQILQPHRWRSPQDEAPLFRYEDGSGLDREGITHYVRIAKLAAGFPSELAGSHSLRKGGATAFYATTGDLERLKRYGGWTSDAVHAYLYEDHTAQKGIAKGMVESSLIPLPSQVDSRKRHAVLEGRTNERDPRLSARARSWGPEPRVTFATNTMAGNAAPPNATEATELFLKNHPGIDLYSLLGVTPNATSTAVLKAFRVKCLTSHPDKYPDPVEKARKTEEFKVLQTAKEILHDPILAFYYREWVARNQVAATVRGRGAERPRPTQQRWPPPPAPSSAASSSSRPPPPPDPKARQHFEEARARFGGRPAEKTPPPRTYGPAGSQRAPRYDPWAEEDEQGHPAYKAAPPKARKAPPPPQPKDFRPRGSVGRMAGSWGVASEATAPGASGSEGYQRPPPARPMASPTTKRARSPQTYQGAAVGVTEDLRAPRVPLGDHMEVDAEGAEEASLPPQDETMTESSSWAAPSASWTSVPNQSWSMPADPADDQSFIYVDAEGSDADSWVTNDSEYIYDEPEEWQTEGADSAFQQREEEAARSGWRLLEQLFKRRTPPAIGLPASSNPMTPEFKENQMAGQAAGYRVDPSVRAWLDAGAPPVGASRAAGEVPSASASTSAQDLPAPQGPPRAWGEQHRAGRPKPPPPAPPGYEESQRPRAPTPPGPGGKPHYMAIPKPGAPPAGSPLTEATKEASKGTSPTRGRPAEAARTPPSTPMPEPTPMQAAPAGGTTPQAQGGADPADTFDPEDVDWGEDEEDPNDDRTPEEKAEDAALLRETKEKMKTFLNAPPEVKKLLRSQLWKKCCEKLQAIRLDPLPYTPHEGLYEADLAAGFSVKEAEFLQKARDRAARHQAALSRMPHLGFDDLPKSWTDPTASQKKLKPGFLKERNARKAQRKWEKQHSRGTHTTSRRSFSTAPKSHGSHGSPPGGSERRAQSAQPKTPVKAGAPKTPPKVPAAPAGAAQSSTAEEDDTWGEWKPQWSEAEWAEWRRSHGPR